MIDEIKKLKLMGTVEENSVEIGDGHLFKGENFIKFLNGAEGNRLIIGKNFSANNVKLVFKGKGGVLRIGDNVKLTGHILIVGQDREVTIGDNSTFQGINFLSREGDIRIGKDCMFSREIEMRTTDVHKIYSLETGERLNKAGDIVIGDHVWVCARATISKGASIGSGSIVGFNSFVNSKFEGENQIVAGCPAKVVKDGIRWER